MKWFINDIQIWYKKHEHENRIFKNESLRNEGESKWIICKENYIEDAAMLQHHLYKSDAIILNKKLEIVW